MKEWTREERYRVLQSADDIRGLYEAIKKSDYRQTFHLQPITGLSSDPNGFVYHKGIWHLFYQWCPWGAVHGLKYWYHTVSKDLVHWENRGVGIYPDSFYDNKGVHSGSGFSTGEALYLFYTGNHRDDNWVRTPYTCVAKLEDSGELVKAPQPLFGPHENYTEHQRDPKVVYDEETQKYYILLGAQSKDLKGKVLIYSSDSLLEGWTFAGELQVPGFENLGGMWECPSIERISGKDVLVFSPQYTTLPHRNQNTNHNVYLLGKMDYQNLTFTAEGDYRHLDYGFDFYAAQFAAGVKDSDRAILTAWMGLPDNHYPTEAEDWEGSLTLPRELRLVNNRLIQRPIEGIASLRKQSLTLDKELPRVCELEVLNARGKNFDLRLFSKKDGSGGFRISYDSKTKLCTVDRSQMDQHFNAELGECLTIPMEDELTKLAVYIDKSSVELFINDGQATFTSHLYPTAAEKYYAADSHLELKGWLLKQAVSDDFVV